MSGQPQPGRHPQGDPNALVDAHAGGDPAAAEALYLHLEPHVRQAARGFLADDHLDEDDVVQETLLAVLAYVRRRGGFSGNLIRFGVTIARNRCRNLYHWRRRWAGQPIESMAEWFQDPARSALDLLQAEEVELLLRRSLEQLDPACRRLLNAFYVDERPAEEIRGELGLETLQGVYYRRQVCLRKAMRALKRRLGSCSFGEVDGDG